MTEIARVMKKIVIDVDHKPHAHGSLLLKRMETVWSSLETQQNRTGLDISMETDTGSLLPETNQSGVQKEINELGLPGMEMF